MLPGEERIDFPRRFHDTKRGRSKSALGTCSDDAIMTHSCAVGKLQPRKSCTTRMSKSIFRAVVATLLVTMALAVGLEAQSTIGALTPPPTPTLFWSQLDTYVGLTRAIDFMMLASGTPGKDGDHPELVLGPNIDIGLLNFIPHLKLTNPEKSKYLTFRIGYRYVKNLYGKETAQKNGVLELTPRLPLPWGFPDRRPQPH